ncbi:Pimeloyl-ACP methyl ester carboxylesterase [Roseovarius azorensis]|uniref:Pimeloyl-ACP methyl ester carboxylesterase n=1 Tax=Roseovarius azorensis TaxID=1287727 RepID=A0A1H7NGC4_9RHOB|nr:alpha/beta fold hydrolase [Roseovarius azorensis]SEL22582.1 Pimeloyl-ACP methyl ester carboxylesterase [Roseovarius azorensis]
MSSDPVVFLPGMMCDGRVFARQIDDLSRDRPVMVAPITGGDRIEEIASGLLDVLPRRFALAGLSMGGIVAMEILRRAPDRVARIALMDTNSLAETPQSVAGYEPFIIKLRAGPLADAVQMLMRPDVLAPGQGRTDVLALVADMARAIGAEAIIRQTCALQRRRDYQAELRRCKVPALVLCGEHDGLTPVKRHSFMAELIPYAELAVIAGAGHLPPLEQPEATTAALRRWLCRPLAQQRRVDA